MKIPRMYKWVIEGGLCPVLPHRKEGQAAELMASVVVDGSLDGDCGHRSAVGVRREERVRRTGGGMDDNAGAAHGADLW